MLQYRIVDFYNDETAAASIEYIMFFSFLSVVVIPAIIEYRDWIIAMLNDITGTLTKLKMTDF